MKRFLAHLIVALGAALGTASLAHAQILIGMAGPLTGPNAWFGEQTERGVTLAVADLNAAGGVLGQQVEVVTADDYCDGEQAIAAANHNHDPFLQKVLDTTGLAARVDLLGLLLRGTGRADCNAIYLRWALGY